MFSKVACRNVGALRRGFTGKGRKSSNIWKTEHVNDPYVKEAQKLDLRSRAAFKLKEINLRYNILRDGHLVVDLGSSPGGWCQASLDFVGKDSKNPRVFAMDIAPMDYLEGTRFMLGDITEGEDLLKLQMMMAMRPADVVISDIAPDITGDREYDSFHVSRLNNHVISVAGRMLRPGGSLLMKTFQGTEETATFKFMEALFKEMYRVKPHASRKRSPELYFLGRLSNKARKRI